MQMGHVNLHLLPEVPQHLCKKLVFPKPDDCVERLTHGVLVEIFRPGTGAEDERDIQVPEQVRVQVQGGAGSKAVTYEEQDALAVGDLMVAPLGEQGVKELEEPIFLEESAEDRVMLERELGAFYSLDNLLHGAS